MSHLIPFCLKEHKRTQRNTIKRTKEVGDAKAGKERKRKISISPICGDEDDDTTLLLTIAEEEEEK